MSEQEDTAGDPKFFFDPDPRDGQPEIDIVFMGDCIGVRYGSLSLVFRGWKAGEED